MGRGGWEGGRKSRRCSSSLPPPPLYFSSALRAPLIDQWFVCMTRRGVAESGCNAAHHCSLLSLLAVTPAPASASIAITVDAVSSSCTAASASSVG